MNTILNMFLIDFFFVIQKVSYSVSAALHLWAFALDVTEKWTKNRFIFVYNDLCGGDDKNNIEQDLD